jgi:cell division transport system permease protein
LNPASAIARLRYCIASSLQNLRRNLTLSLITTSTIAVMFTICTSMLLVLLNLSAFMQTWADQLQIIVYFEMQASAKDMQRFEKEIEARPEVEQVRHVSPEEAMRLLKGALEGQDGILYGLPDNPLPASLEIRLHKPYLTNDAVEAFVAGITRAPPVADIEYGQRWLERFIAFFELARLTCLLLGVFLIIFTYCIIANTIRLMVYSRRDEIEIMKLVGAGSLMVKFPFWLEGALQGACGAALALLIVLGVEKLAMHNLATLLHFYLGSGSYVFLDWPMAAAITAAGALLGLAGSFFAVNHLDAHYS